MASSHVLKILIDIKEEVLPNTVIESSLHLTSLFLLFIQF